MADELPVIAKNILWFGEQCVLACDGNCQKAWGINNRPRIYLEDPELRVYGGDFSDEFYPDDDSIDPDNHVHLADHELGIAPIDPGTYEGDEGKPLLTDERLNKWCARECERSVIEIAMEDVELPDYSQRFYNIAPHTRPN